LPFLNACTEPLGIPAVVGNVLDAARVMTTGFRGPEGSVRGNISCEPRMGKLAFRSSPSIISVFDRQPQRRTLSAHRSRRCAQPSPTPSASLHLLSLLTSHVSRSSPVVNPRVIRSLYSCILYVQSFFTIPRHSFPHSTQSVDVLIPRPVQIIASYVQIPLVAHPGSYSLFFDSFSCRRGLYQSIPPRQFGRSSGRGTGLLV
jgi:hypothetical protein